MIISNEFTVGADAETVWRHLLDMEGVAGCLPGASIEATEEENTYNGTMRVRIGPMTVDYRGTATLAEVDAEGRTATISLRAREARGQGTAMATIRNRLEPGEGGTRVIAETDLHITGPQAQFGRGVMEDVGGRVLSEFSSRLERRIAGEDGGSEAGEPAAAASSADGRPASAAGEGAVGDRGDEDDALDLGALLSQSVVGRYARAGAVLVVVVLLAIVARRRSR